MDDNYENSLVEIDTFINKMRQFPSKVKNAALSLIQETLLCNDKSVESLDCDTHDILESERESDNDIRNSSDLLSSDSSDSEGMGQVENEINVVISKFRNSCESNGSLKCGSQIITFDKADEDRNVNSRQSYEPKCNEKKRSDTNDDSDCNILIGEDCDDSKVYHRCNSCEYATRSTRLLELHYKREHNINVLVCHLCARSIKHYSSFLCHMKRHNNDRKYKCDHCEYKCYTKNEIGKHMTMHTGEKNEMCQHCGKMYAKDCTLKEHVTTMHERIKKYECTQCDFYTYRSNSLKLHIRSKHGEELNLVCPICYVEVKHRQALISHMRTHTGDKPFSCEKCGRSFTCLTNLTVHQKTVHEPRQFLCKHCSKCFQTKHHLLRHESIHTKDKPFSCMYCSYSSNTHGNLTKHVRSVHNKQDFSFRKYKTGQKVAKQPARSELLQKSQKISEEYLKDFSIEIGRNITIEELKKQEMEKQNHISQRIEEARQKRLKRIASSEHSYHSKSKNDKYLKNVPAEDRKYSVSYIILQNGDILNVRDIELLPEVDTNRGMSTEIYSSADGSLFLLEKRRTESNTVSVEVRKIIGSLEYISNSEDNILYATTSNSEEVPILLTKSSDENVNLPIIESSGNSCIIKSIDLPIVLSKSIDNGKILNFEYVESNCL